MNTKSFPSYPVSSSGPSLSTIFFHLSLIVLCIGFFLFISTTASEAFEQTQKPLILLHFIRDESSSIPTLETKGIADKGKKISDDTEYDTDSDDEEYVPPSTKKINNTKNKQVVDDDDEEEEEK
jgi:hypothetical protein